MSINDLLPLPIRDLLSQAHHPIVRLVIKMSVSGIVKDPIPFFEQSIAILEKEQLKSEQLGHMFVGTMLAAEKAELEALLIEVREKLKNPAQFAVEAEEFLRELDMVRTDG